MEAKVFMLGWEFPPFISGGLGTACYGLTKAMSRMGADITFVLPKAVSSSHSSHITMRSAEGCVKTEGGVEFENVHFKTIVSPLKPYVSCGTGQGCTTAAQKHSVSYWESGPSEKQQNYGGDTYTQVHRYACKAAELGSVEEFDVIHAHDWMTYPAGVAVAAASGKPLVVHVHSTEFDRSGEHINQMVYDIERQGMHQAAKVISVSGYTKDIISSRYGVDPNKIEVVYNGVENNPAPLLGIRPHKTGKIVLFLGRMTLQKGPEYFIAAAKKVLEKISDVKFIMAGDGDMTHRMIDYAASLGIGHKVFFTRFLHGADVDRVFRMADLYVMPSVSEPFGIAPLEALRNRVPVLISKQSGIAEILRNALTVDFWDIHQTANKIAAVLRYPALSGMLRENGFAEIEKFRWEDAAAKVIEVYHKVLPAKTSAN